MGKPKIRFKGFTEDWEQRKFEMCIRDSIITVLCPETPDEVAAFWGFWSFSITH